MQAQLVWGNLLGLLPSLQPGLDLRWLKVEQQGESSPGKCSDLFVDVCFFVLFCLLLFCLSTISSNAWSQPQGVACVEHVGEG